MALQWGSARADNARPTAQRPPRRRRPRRSAAPIRRRRKAPGHLARTVSGRRGVRAAPAPSLRASPLGWTPNRLPPGPRAASPEDCRRVARPRQKRDPATRSGRADSIPPRWVSWPGHLHLGKELTIGRTARVGIQREAALCPVDLDAQRQGGRRMGVGKIRRYGETQIRRCWWIAGCTCVNLDGRVADQEHGLLIPAHRRRDGERQGRSDVRHDRWQSRDGRYQQERCRAGGETWVGVGRDPEPDLIHDTYGAYTGLKGGRNYDANA